MIIPNCEKSGIKYNYKCVIYNLKCVKYNSKYDSKLHIKTI